ncbi:hypothetical protein [Porphyromonas phage phage007a_Bg4]
MDITINFQVKGTLSCKQRQEIERQAIQAALQLSCSLQKVCAENCKKDSSLFSSCIRIEDTHRRHDCQCESDSRRPIWGRRPSPEEQELIRQAFDRAQ